ncbi:MAG: SGNH/GDSL hydrolase family protein, partial [Clostridia bacterium]|nr:SGNH/GDSL hydrolase family protein [Clostridia bacterium]
MTIETFYRTFTSAGVTGSANQVLTRDAEPVLRTGRVWFRLSRGGERIALLFSGRIDSTFADGSISRANDPGGDWEIRSLRVGLTENRGEEPDDWIPVTFDGSPCRSVQAGEGEFASDPIPLPFAGGAYLAYEITLCGACYPYHEELVLNAFCRDGDGWRADKRFPVPLMIGCDRPARAKIGFLGDSITQGCGTAYDSYTHWAAKIAEGLPDDLAVWDLGIGYARASDAATDGGWLARAKRCDVVNVCLGVNDLCRDRTDEAIIADLTVIVHALKAAGCRVILFTVPPFDFTGIARDRWYAVNHAVRESIAKDADALFDFAAVLGKPAPDEHLSVYGGHPNAEGCAVAAKAYLEEDVLGKVLGTAE